MSSVSMCYAYPGDRTVVGEIKKNLTEKVLLNYILYKMAGL